MTTPSTSQTGTTTGPLTADEIAAVRAGQVPPSGATISSALPGPAKSIGTQT